MRFNGQFIPAGTIMLWSGAVAGIPAGWILCNGSNGTPDLRNNFVVGAGDTYNPDATGGAATHNHTGEQSHTHNLMVGVSIAAGSDYGIGTGGPQKTGTTGTASNIPPYYALCYIMKV